MATFNALFKVGASVQGADNVRALSAALKQITEETRQLIALQRAQANVARVLLDNQIAAAKTDRERAALASQRIQMGLKASENEYAATIKQLAAQKQLQAEQVKVASDRLRAADAAMKQALVVTNAMRSEKLAAEENLQVQIQKAKAQYQSIANLKQIAQLERQAAIAAAEGAEAANKRAQAAANKAKMDAQTFSAFREMEKQAAANKARMDAQTFAAFKEMDRETQRRQKEAAKAQAAYQQQMLAGMQSVKSMALSAAAALGVFSAVQVGANIVAAGQEAELTRRRINAVAGELGETAGVYEIAARGADKFAIANIDSQIAVANLYNRLRPMGVSLSQIETVYTGVNKAVLLGGLSAYDATEAFRQLGQAMGSGRLQGDELRSLMERMPAIGVALAKVMNVSVGEIKKLGSDGKITTDVIIKATEELAKLQPPEPTQFQRYTAAAKNLSTTIAEALMPVLIGGANNLRVFVDATGSWIAANKNVIVGLVTGVTEAIKALLPVAGGLATFAGVQWAASLVKLASGFNLVRTAAQLATLAQAAYMSLTPVGAGVLLAGLVAGAFAYRKIKDEMDALDKKARETGAAATGAATAITEQSIAAAQATSAAMVAQTAAASEAAAAATAAEESKKRQVELEKEMLEAQRQAVAYMDVQFQQVERINSLAAAKAERIRDVAQQTLSVEQAQIDVARAILDGKMSMATSDEERLRITRELAELDKRAAEANYAAAMAQIEAERQLEKIRVINAENNFRRARAAYDIAVNLGTLTNEITAKLETARGDLMASAAQNVAFGTATEAKTTVAGLNLQAAKIRADNALNQPTQPVSFGGIPIAPGNNFFTVNGQVLSGFPAFAKGAHVKGPTLALIGEGGEGESVVPDSKRVGFAMNVLRGISGAAAIPAFAKGGYIAGENPANRGWQSSIGTSAFEGATETRNDMTYTFDPFGTIRLSQAIARASQAKKNATGKGGLSEEEKNQIIRSMGGEITPFGGFRMNAPRNAWFTNDLPKSTMSAPKTVNVTTSINAQTVAPDMFLVNGDEVRRMALEVAQQAIGQNNAQQRQPSARRRAGVR